VRDKLSYLCSSINLQVSLDFLYEFKFLSSFVRIECTYQDKTHCSTKEPLRASYGRRKMIFSKMPYGFLLLQENKVKRHKLNSSTRISTYLVLEIALDQYLHNGSCT
jgi:hypothetical protein